MLNQSKLLKVLAGILAYSKNEYEISGRQKQNALDNKAIGLYPMSPKDFLNLTTGSKELKHIQDNAKSLEFYQGKVEEGDSLVHPFIDYDEKGKVLRHEGRHRAQAVINAGGGVYWVALYPDRKHRNYEESALPTTLRGQFGTGAVMIDHDKVEWIEFNMSRGQK